MESLTLLSPTNGRPLRRVSEHLLTDGERRWPVVDGIPYLREKETVRGPAVAAIEAGNVRGATIHLLRDQDDFSPTAPPTEMQLSEMLDRPPETLRECMRVLNYGPVGDYFAYRWCSPTFLSGLRLLEMSVPDKGLTIEYACGIGHFLRELELAGRDAVGVDIVFSKLWLARHYLEVAGLLVCGDVEAGPVVKTEEAATVFCHDAFYFLRKKGAALQHMRSVGERGRVVIGHVHTDRDAHQAGVPLPTQNYGELTAAAIWDDAAVADDFYLRRGESPVRADGNARAVSWIEGDILYEQQTYFDKDYGSRVLNPLLSGQGISWPSQGWKEEFFGDTERMRESPLERLRTQAVGRPVAANGTALKSAPEEIKKQVDNGVLLNLPPRW